MTELKETVWATFVGLAVIVTVQCIATGLVLRDVEAEDRARDVQIVTLLQHKQHGDKGWCFR